MNQVKIGTRLVGEGQPTFIIAEIGSNHDNKLSQALEMIDVAAESGADAVKFQIFSDDTLYPKKTKSHKILTSLQMDREWLPSLKEYAQKKKIIFLATPFDMKAVNQMADIDAPAYKWASPEIHDLPLLCHAATKGKPIILSTGMCNLTDIEEAVNAVYSSGNNQLILLHCVSLYPTEARFANLRIMDTLKMAFQLPVGFSDHTTGISVPAAAVARGACVIEKHFTLSKKLDGPDHGFAMEPHELKQMVLVIREVEQSLGSPIKSFIQGQENPALNNKSLTTTKKITAGTQIKEDMITVKRSNDGIRPKHLSVVLGRTARIDIEEDTPLTWEAI